MRIAARCRCKARPNPAILDPVRAAQTDKPEAQLNDIGTIALRDGYVQPIQSTCRQIARFRPNFTGARGNGRFKNWCEGRLLLATLPGNASATAAIESYGGI